MKRDYTCPGWQHVDVGLDSERVAPCPMCAHGDPIEHCAASHAAVCSCKATHRRPAERCHQCGCDLRATRLVYGRFMMCMPCVVRIVATQRNSV